MDTNMSDWLHSLPVAWMALLVFGVTYLLAAAIYAVVMSLDRARSIRPGSHGPKAMHSQCLRRPPSHRSERLCRALAEGFDKLISHEDFRAVGGIGPGLRGIPAR